jgi:hypothetical protein
LHQLPLLSVLLESAACPCNFSQHLLLGSMMFHPGLQTLILDWLFIIIAKRDVNVNRWLFLNSAKYTS